MAGTNHELVFEITSATSDGSTGGEATPRAAAAPGESTQPSLEAIDAVPHKWAGCCYQHTTHACECHETEQQCENWIATERAAHFAKCKVGNGQMIPVNDPLWYHYSGKDDPTAVSFAADP